MRGKALRSKLMIRLRQLRAATITLGSGIQARVQRSPRTAPHSLRAFGLPRRKWQAWRRPDLIRERRLREMRPDRVGAILHIFIDPVTKQEGNLPQKCGPAEWMQTPDGAKEQSHGCFRCLVPRYRGASYHDLRRDELRGNFFTAAPQRLRRLRRRAPASLSSRRR
jgi:hypothetical protein